MGHVLYARDNFSLILRLEGRAGSDGSVSQKIWLNLDHFRNCREFNSVWRISLAFANRPILHYGNGLRNIGGEAPPAQIKVPSAFGKYAPFSI